MKPWKEASIDVSYVKKIHSGRAMGSSKTVLYEKIKEHSCAKKSKKITSFLKMHLTLKVL